MTYEQLLQLQPTTAFTGSKDAASEFLSAINTFFARGDHKSLTPSQINYLYKLKARWQSRAQGQDESWMQYGSRPGRRKTNLFESRSGVDHTAYGTEDELDPLLRSLLHKYPPKQ